MTNLCMLNFKRVLAHTPIELIGSLMKSASQVDGTLLGRSIHQLKTIAQSSCLMEVIIIPLLSAELITRT